MSRGADNLGVTVTHGNFLIELVHVVPNHVSKQENGFHLHNVLRLKMICNDLSRLDPIRTFQKKKNLNEIIFVGRVLWQLVVALVSFERIHVKLVEVDLTSY